MKSVKKAIYFFKTLKDNVHLTMIIAGLYPD